MPANPALENVFGTIGAVLWTIQIIPQVWKSYRTKNTDGLSGDLMGLWAIASMFLGTYLIVLGVSIPLIIQPQSFGALSALSWAQCLHYSKGVSVKRCSAYLLAFYVTFGGFEVAMTFALRAAERRGITGITMAFGIIAAVLLAGALLPQYYEIWVYKEVKGISLTFMAIDILGGVFCILSLAFKDTLDGIGTASYAGVVVLDSIVIICAAILNPRAKRRRAREGAVDEEMSDAGPSSGTPASGVSEGERKEDNGEAVGRQV